MQLDRGIGKFKAATIANASESVKEPGIARFDVVQDNDDPTHFVLVEVYRTADDPARHKETAHYLAWRESVADWMAGPRQGVPFNGLFHRLSRIDRQVALLVVHLQQVGVALRLPVEPLQSLQQGFTRDRLNHPIQPVQQHPAGLLSH